MNFKMKCPHCDQSISAEDEMQGKSFPCPSCGVDFIVLKPPAPVTAMPVAIAETSELPKVSKIPWFKRTWLHVILFIFVPYIQIALMWVVKVFNVRIRVILTILGILLTLFYFSDEEGTSHSEQKGTSHSEQISSIEDAQKFLIGTWTQTGQESQKYMGTRWHKWVIKPGGKIDSYAAQANDDGWGEPTEITYEVITAKFSDTGGRFYGIKPSTSYADVISDDGNLYMQVPNLPATSLTEAVVGYTLKFERGDNNPFDK